MDKEKGEGNALHPMNYYNEHDPKAAAWLRELIAQKQIPQGVVDTRSILDVQATDLYDYTQCHFFAGIGGWSLALRLSGWPEDRPIWTGSCPCQPFSSAGKKRKTKDPRHLWPELRRLIEQGNPPVVFGEQVASKDGRVWLSGVRADLEALAYEVGAADLCAAGIGAPHIRQRLYWVANAEVNGFPREQNQSESSGWYEPAGGSPIDGMEHPSLPEGPRQRSQREHVSGQATQGMGNPASNDQRGQRESFPGDGWSGALGGPGFWSDFDIIQCLDGKARCIESGTFPLAHGVSGRVGLLRGYGNAIVPEIAAQFILAFTDARPLAPDF
jgi:DNA (cytosine-5)-methyltransferase 1